MWILYPTLYARSSDGISYSPTKLAVLLFSTLTATARPAKHEMITPRTNDEYEKGNHTGLNSVSHHTTGISSLRIIKC